MKRFWESLFEMKHLQDCQPPIAWLMLILQAEISIVLILRPTVFEFFSLAFLDLVLMFKINQLFEGKVFTTLYPDTKRFFSYLNINEISKYLNDEKIALVDSFFKYPGRRVKFFLLWSLVKCTPAILFITFFFKDPDSIGKRFLVAIGITLSVSAFASGSILVHSHIFVSQLLATLHRRLDFSKVFSKLNLDYSTKQLERQELLSQISLFFFVILLEVFVISRDSIRPVGQVIFETCTIGGCGLLLFIYNWRLGRRFLTDGLSSIFSAIQNTDFKKNQKLLPLHSSPLLATFEKTFNSLLIRLKKSETSFHHLLNQEVDRSRYNTLGEISGLVAHDLSGPLHVINFCFSELKEDPSKIKDERYLKYLELNLARIESLISSIVSKIKNTSENSISSFSDIHDKVTTLLETQFKINSFDTIQICLDSRLKNLHLGVSEVDLTHILDNLYRNSIKNFIENEISNPQLDIFLIKITDDHAQIGIHDNGTGLDPVEYEILSTLNTQTNTERSSVNKNKGLGLKLTRKLIELIGEEITLEKTDRPGTFFKIKLPLAQVSSLKTNSLLPLKEIENNAEFLTIQ